MEQFKYCGVKRVIIATTALCMGVNFPDVWFIINWGPARSILDQHQEAGRAGRDGKRAHVAVINFIMGNKLDIVNNRSKILSILKAVFLLLRINHWMTRFNLWNLLVTAVLFVRQFASVLVKVVMQKLCLLQQLRTVTAIMWSWEKWHPSGKGNIERSIVWGLVWLKSWRACIRRQL